jgi:hypothetical protein
MDLECRISTKGLLITPEYRRKKISCSADSDHGRTADCYQSEGCLVGAVGIENNTAWYFKDLEEMMGSAKALKRNNGEPKGILIGPLRAPRFSQKLRFSPSGILLTVSIEQSASGSNFAVRMASRTQLH